MADFPEETRMQVGPALWQKIFASVVAAIIGGCALWMAGSILWPATFASPNDWEKYTPGGRAFLLIVATGLFGATLYYWWSGIHLRLRADSRGITQTNGFTTTFVRWESIASYTIEDVGSYKEHMYEPVLRNDKGRILLRPILPLIVSSARVREARAQFWSYVTSRIDAGPSGNGDGFLKLPDMD